MKVKYAPEGGRHGWGFSFYCVECDEYVGNSSEVEFLTHPSVKIVRKGFFGGRTVPIDCSQVGMKAKIELPTMELPNL